MTGVLTSYSGISLKISWSISMSIGWHECVKIKSQFSVKKSLVHRPLKFNFLGSNDYRADASKTCLEGHFDIDIDIIW